MSGKYSSLSDLPDRLPLFPLSGALLLPRTQMPLNIFEPRYLQMVDDALAGHRVIGMVQPEQNLDFDELQDPDAHPALYRVGCAGRITSFMETEDNRYLITLTGISRFMIEREHDAMTAYRQCKPAWSAYKDDLRAGHGEEDVARERLLDVLKTYLKVNGLNADWNAIKSATNESLVNSLSVISPYGPSEKQALLEAKTLEDRNQMLIALTEMALARDSNDGSGTVQ